MHQLLVGTKKGLFVLRGDATRGLPRSTRGRSTARSSSSRCAIPGPGVLRLRDERVLRPSVDVHRRPRGRVAGGRGPGVPRRARISPSSGSGSWSPGEADGLLYAGVDPAALFVSTDGGRELVAEPGPLDRTDRRRLAAGVRRARAALDLPLAGRPAAAGDRRLRGRRLAHARTAADRGARASAGLVPEYLPEEAREGSNELCVHNMHRAPHRARAPVHAVPRQRVPERRRRRDLERHRRGAAQRVRLPPGRSTRTTRTAHS